MHARHEPALALAFLALAGCGNEAGPSALPALEACADPRCRLAALDAAWAEDPQATAQFVARQANGVERRTLMVRVLERFPDQRGLLCERLTQPADRKECERPGERPHMDPGRPTEHARERELDQRAGGGPKENRLPSPGLEAMGWFSTGGDPALMAPCQAQPDPSHCAQDLAVAALAAGELARASGICQEASRSRNSWECYLQAAGRVVTEQGAKTYRHAAPFCTASGEFFGFCQASLLDALVRQGAGEVGAGAVREAWEATDPAMALTYEDRFLSLWLQLEDAPITDPVLEARAAPHRRLEAAFSTLEAHPGLEDLDRASALATEHAAPRSATLLPTEREDEPPRLWQQDHGIEARLPALHLRGIGRRTAGEGEAADLAICLLEAAARVSPPRVELLVAGLEPERSERTRWTAARLLSRVKPGRLVGHRDPSELVRGRLPTPTAEGAR